MVQDLATQWIQSYPCKTKTSQETEKSLQKFLEPKWKTKVIHTDNSLNLAKLVKIYLGIIVRGHLTVQKHMGLLRGRYAGLKKGLVLNCCNLVWMKNGGRIPWRATAICERYKISCLMGNTLRTAIRRTFLMDE